MRTNILTTYFALFSLAFLGGCSEVAKQDAGGKGGASASGGEIISDSWLPAEPVVNQASNPTQNSVVISWSQGIDEKSARTGSYNLKYGTSATLQNPTVLKSVSSPYTLSGLTPGTQYYYLVEAENSVGVRPSNILSFTTSAGLPGAPVLGSISALQNSAMVNWTAGASATSHTIYYSTNPNLAANIGSASMLAATVSPASVTALTANTTYYFLVRATNPSGTIDSGVGSATTLPAAPAAPVPGTVTALQTSATIPWTAGSGGGAVSSYDIKYGTSSTLASATTVMGVTSPYGIPSGANPLLTAGTTYYYQITAKNSAGNTSSAILSFATQAVAMGVPIIGATTGITSSGAVLHWSAPSTGAPVSYRVRYGTNSSFSPSTTINNAVDGQTLSGLTAGTIYYFEVSAVYASSSTSSTGSFTTLVAAPAVPASPAAAPQQTSATITWTAGSGGGPVSSYDVAYGTSSTLASPTTLAGSSSPLSIPSLAAGTTYYYRITAKNNGGNASTAILSFATQAIPMGVPIIGATTGITSSAAVLHWNPPASGTPNSYTIRYGTNSSFSPSTTIANAPIATGQTLSGLTAGTIYYFEISAVYAASSSASTGSFTTLVAAPSAPSGAAAVPQQTSATLSWAAGSGGGPVSSYDVAYGTSSTLASPTTLTGATSPLSLPTLNAGTTYYYRITAKNNGGNASTAILSFMTLAPPMGGPVITSTTGITSSGAVLHWNAPVSGTPTSYTIRYGTNSSFSPSTTIANAPIATGQTLTGLTAGTIYYFEISAVYSAGSTPATSSFTTLIGAPGAPVLGATTPSQTSSLVAWTAGAGGNVSSYNLSYSAGATLSGSPTVLTNVISPYNLTGLTAGTVYSYRVTAVNPSGTANSTTGNFTTLLQAPNAPVIASPITVTQTGATVAWSPASSGGAPSSYSFKIGSSSDLSSVTAQTGQTSPKVLTGLNASATYYIQVIAINSAGQAVSAVASFTTSTPAPATPVLVSTTGITSSGAVVGWWSGIGGATSLASFKTTLMPVMQNRCASCHNTDGLNGTSAHGSASDVIALDAMYWVNPSGQKKVDFANTSNSFMYQKLMGGHQCGTNCAAEVLTAINSWKTGGGVDGTLPTSYKLKYNTGSTLSGSPTILSSVVSPRTLASLAASTQYAFAVEATGPGGVTNSATANFTTSAAPAPSPTPSPTASPTSTPTSGPIAYNVALTLADRRYVYKTLIDLFSVTDATLTTTLKNNIWFRPEFGGGCDLYAAVPNALNVNTREYPDERCDNGLSEDTRATTNAPRFAYKSKACNALVNNATALNNFIAKISATPTVNDANLVKAYQLFNPEESPSTDVKTKLTAVGAVAGASATDTAKWKLIVFALCVDPGWDKP